MPLYVIRSLSDPLINLLADDPVRPEIPAEFRVSATAEIFVLQDKDTLEPEAVVCVSYHDMIPADILELARDSEGELTTAVFYTIWSYKPKAGRKLIQAAQKYIGNNYATITEFVTLSPQTDMARRFHMLNGAQEFRINGDTVNYLYKSKSQGFLE